MTLILKIAGRDAGTANAITLAAADDRVIILHGPWPDAGVAGVTSSLAAANGTQARNMFDDDDDDDITWEDAEWR